MGRFVSLGCWRTPATGEPVGGFGTDCLYELGINDQLEVQWFLTSGMRKDTHDTTEGKRPIPKGTVCTFCGWDASGDALVRMGARSTLVFLESFAENMAWRLHCKRSMIKK